MNSEDDFGAVGYLAPQSLEGHKSLGRQFSINDSGKVLSCIQWAKRN